jgi:rare lipoprotein A
LRVGSYKLVYKVDTALTTRYSLGAKLKGGMALLCPDSLRLQVRNVCETIRWCVSVVTLIALFAGCSAIRNTGMPSAGEIQFGMASWYGKEFHGRVTTSGEKYDMHKLTAAHRRLPFDTLVRVTNIKNGKSVIVRINDRGPWKPGRVIDLSYAAAEKIGITKEGVARVRLDIVDKQTGMASWYGQKFHGRRTASGEIYDMNQLTAAHSDLPFGAIVRVTNVENGKVVTVRINDRMPRSQKRMINLSRQAAEKLDMLKRGIAMVAIDISGPATAR